MREVLMIAALVIISYVFLLQLSENIMLFIREKKRTPEATIKAVKSMVHEDKFHIHDECIIDCPDNMADLEKPCEIMGQPIQ